MNDHTPGPWTYIDEGPREVRLKRDHWAVGSLDSREGIAIVFRNEANACLIAAAPALLALAQQYAVECAECFGKAVSDDTGQDCEGCADIRAVIAKATGNS
jgi:hypothetical protein